MDPFRKPSPGDKFKASSKAWASFVDVAKAYQRGEFGPRRPKIDPGNPQALQVLGWNPEVAVERYSTVAIYGTPHFYGQPGFTSQPTLLRVHPYVTDSYGQRWGIAVDGIKVKEVGPVVMAGVCTARVNWGGITDLNTPLGPVVNSPCLSPRANGRARALYTAHPGEDDSLTVIVLLSEWGDDEVWVRLDYSTAIAGTTNRWTYTGTVYTRTATGFTAAYPAQTISGIVNSMESGNSASGVQGNGINITGDDFPAGFSLQPAHVGHPIVRAKREYLADATLVWTIQVANAVDGTCGT